MIVLGLDTSTPSSAAALLLPGGGTIEARDDPAPGEHPGHATRLLDLVRGLLSSAGLGWGDLERLAVGVGPGTFTGLRVGVATARGLAQSLSLPIVPVSSLAALAEAALREEIGRADVEPGVIAVIDARRGEAFAAAYVPAAAPAEDPVGLSDPRPLSPEGLRGLARGSVAGAGGGDRRWIGVGDGAIRYRASLEPAGVEVPPGDSPLHRVSASVVCRAGARGPAGELARALPDYRRRPDAELALDVPAGPTTDDDD